MPLCQAGDKLVNCWASGSASDCGVLGGTAVWLVLVVSGAVKADSNNEPWPADALGRMRDDDFGVDAMGAVA
jgi:hypothetical protein